MLILGFIFSLFTLEVSLLFVFVCFTLGLYAGLLNIQEEWENYDINEAVVLVAWILC